MHPHVDFSPLDDIQRPLLQILLRSAWFPSIGEARILAQSLEPTAWELFERIIHIAVASGFQV